MTENPIIPAATVQDVDLTGSDAALAAEIRRLGNLMELGDESPEEFSRLVRLLVEAGCGAKAEYLLRRNVVAAAGEQALYRELFGTAKPDEFAASIAAFASQFEVELEFVAGYDFLDAKYRVRPCVRRPDDFGFLSEPGEVRFDFSEPDHVSAHVSSSGGRGHWPLYWLAGEWKHVTAVR